MTSRMMKSAIIFFLVAVSARAGASGLCTTTASSNKLFMKSQPDHVGHCGAFAFRALLHQHRCKMDPKNCALPSVVDIIAKSTKHNRKDLVMVTGMMLDALQRDGGSVADEKCLSYSSFWPTPAGAGEKISYNQNYAAMTLERMKSSMPNAEYCKIRSQLGQLDRVSKEIAAAITKVGEDVYVEKRKFAEASRCPRRPLPRANLAYTRNTGGPETLMGLLDQGHSVMTPLFLKEPDGTTRGYHAVVVTNYRQKCCAGVCVRSFQVIDSLGYYWAQPGASTDGWVDESVLIGSIASDARLVTMH